MSADLSRNAGRNSTPNCPGGQIELGKVVGVWGVQGYIKVYSYTRDPEGISKYDDWLLEAAGRETEFKVIECRRQGQGLVARLEGISDRDEAGKLVGCRILVDRDELPVLPEGEYYWHDLVGLTVVNLDGQSLGDVDHLLETGANDVLVIQDGDVERLVPYVPTMVSSVDLEAGVMTVDWQPGWDSDMDAKSE